MTASRLRNLPKPLRFVGQLIRSEFGRALGLLWRLPSHLAAAYAICRALPQALLFYLGSWRFPIRRILGVLTRERFTGVTRRANFLMDRATSTSRLLKQSSIILYAALPRPALEFMLKVSIIVPNFNHSKYLLKRLESIYGQTYGNVEVILLDDCSSDGGVAILHDFAEHYPGKTICRFYEVNSDGVFNQWKKSVEFGTGELMWIAESDDYCDKGFLEKLVPFFSDESVLLNYAQFILVNESSEHLPFAFENYVSQIDAYN